MRWYELGVQRYGSVYSFLEYVLRHRRNRYKGRGVLETGSIAVGTEYGDFVGGGSEGFEAFVGLLTVVEGGGHAVEAEVGVGDELGGRPLSSFGAVMGFYVAVDWNWVLVVLVRYNAKWRGEEMQVPSRTLKPISSQLMVLTGGGGNDILTRRL